MTPKLSWLCAAAAWLGVAGLIFAAGCDRPTSPENGRAATVRFPADTVVVRMGDSAAFPAGAYTRDGRPLDAGKLRYSVADPAHAAVSGSGVLRGITPGRTRIVATADGASDTAVAYVPAHVGFQVVNSQPVQGGGAVVAYDSVEFRIRVVPEPEQRVASVDVRTRDRPIFGGTQTSVGQPRPGEAVEVRYTTPPLRTGRYVFHASAMMSDGRGFVADSIIVDLQRKDPVVFLRSVNGATPVPGGVIPVADSFHVVLELTVPHESRPVVMVQLRNVADRTIVHASQSVSTPRGATEEVALRGFRAPGGRYSVEPVAYVRNVDGVSLAAVVGPQVQVEVTQRDRTPPVFRIIAPGRGATVRDSLIDLRVEVADDGRLDDFGLVLDWPGKDPRGQAVQRCSDTNLGYANSATVLSKALLEVAPNRSNCGHYRYRPGTNRIVLHARDAALNERRDTLFVTYVP